MNQRESSGLPLRAMVMVLLFLGVVFLLVAFQAMGGSDDDSDTSSATSVTSTINPTTTTTPTSTESDAPRPEVRVYNVSDVDGAADRVATQLKDQQWNARAENLPLNEVPAETTVYWGPTPGERAAAEDVGAILQAPVVERIPELGDQPPGVIVVVTG
ncbi:LytR C-terminal domain-containing protein [Mycolicibacterium arenosum]|uniref:LytR C-terminal domain-containing protein n=1 Tax=Mycolicibacterium arenosum TaxID=2952157 RepID=A0ABT1LYL2_9MYCO|nr:LytR C-terminal domain-containing protein [Mycolicibacterium sp. CAU 1645]MCP9271988.1 LytR C-terminal domain-containing protein [Mycolicibacterium sp. CAU 1645]